MEVCVADSKDHFGVCAGQFSSHFAHACCLSAAYASLRCCVRSLVLVLAFRPGPLLLCLLKVRVRDQMCASSVSILCTQVTR